MNVHTWIPVAAITVLATSGLFAQPEVGSDRPAAQQRPPRAKPIIERFDRDGDGQLGPDERAEVRAAWRELRAERSELRRDRRAERRKQLRERADINGDGQLDDGERSALRERVREFRRQHAEQRFERRFDRRERRAERRFDRRERRLEHREHRRDAAPSEGDRAQPKPQTRDGELRQRVLQRFDVNGDGALDASELDALLKARAEGLRPGGDRPDAPPARPRRDRRRF
ncbi:MAG: hypothetical protein KDC38_04320 [Planctomycetes bacterium]|nr:hypothetical protein [Planctomycetota bacterium]